MFVLILTVLLLHQFFTLVPVFVQSYLCLQCSLVMYQYILIEYLVFYAAFNNVLVMSRRFTGKLPVLLFVLSCHQPVSSDANPATQNNVNETGDRTRDFPHPKRTIYIVPLHPRGGHQYIAILSTQAIHKLYDTLGKLARETSLSMHHDFHLNYIVIFVSHEVCVMRPIKRLHLNS